MLLGLRTVVYPVGDLNAGKDWYAKVACHGPHFDQPFYVGFAVGGFELGLVPDGIPGKDGGNAYWGVASAKEASEWLIGLGAKPSAKGIEDVGGGILVAEFDDPFGNTFAVIENPHFKLSDVR